MGTNIAAPTGPAYLTIAQTAIYLNVSESFIRRLITTEQLAVSRFGRRVLVPVASVTELEADAARGEVRGGHA